MQDLWVLLDRIEGFGELGVLGREELEEVWSRSRRLRVDEMVNRFLFESEREKKPAIAFWLPREGGQNFGLGEVCGRFDETFVWSEKTF